eukprot:15469109-Alexandrium_andersonii.AAC.1
MAPIANIINAGVLAEEHVAALDEQLTKAEYAAAEEPPMAGVAEAARVDETMGDVEDLPRAEALPPDAGMQDEPAP